MAYHNTNLLKCCFFSELISSPFFPCQCLNRIEEGTYGVVYRAKDKKTNQIVALKRLKMEREKEGFPITSLREINTLLISQHENVVTVREIVVGSNMDKIYIGKQNTAKSNYYKHYGMKYRPSEILTQLNAFFIKWNNNDIFRWIVEYKQQIYIAFFLVMDFVEHDLKSLMETMREKKQVTKGPFK